MTEVTKHEVLKRLCNYHCCGTLDHCPWNHKEECRVVDPPCFQASGLSCLWPAYSCVTDHNNAPLPRSGPWWDPGPARSSLHPCRHCRQSSRDLLFLSGSQALFSYGRWWFSYMYQLLTDFNVNLKSLYIKLRHIGEWRRTSTHS